jgi:hypothetical protein
VRNFRNVVIVLIATFAIASIISELHKPAPGEHGRLYRDRAKQEPVEVVVEAPPVREIDPAPAASADPMLMSAAIREQYLGVDPHVTATPRYVASMEDSSLPKLGGGTFVDAEDQEFHMGRPSPPERRAGQRVVISGGAGGVSIHVR